MTISSALASFAVVAGLLTLIPGLDTALVLRSTAARGRAHGFATALGINTGALCWGAAAACGATAVLTVSQEAYLGLRIAGAAYLLWLGVGTLRMAAKSRPTESASIASSGSRKSVSAPRPARCDDARRAAPRVAQFVALLGAVSC